MQSDKIAIWVSPSDKMEAAKNNIFTDELYRILRSHRSIQVSSIDDKKLCGKILAGQAGENFFINWLDIVYDDFLPFKGMGAVLREVCLFLMAPITLFYLGFFLLKLDNFLKSNMVYYYSHDMRTFSRSRVFQLFDFFARRKFLENSTVVFFAESQCRIAVEQAYGLNISQGIIAPLGDYTRIGVTSEKAALRRRFGIHVSKPVIVYPGTVRKGYRDISEKAEIDLLRGGCVIIKVGRGQKRNIDHPDCHVFSGFIEDEIFEALVCLADFTIIPTERYLTSAVARTSIQYGVPVISQRFGSVADMCEGCLVEFVPDEPVHELLKRLPNRDSFEYEQMVGNALLRASERTWEKTGVVILDTVIENSANTN